MHREPDVGLDPGSPGSRPGPKAGAKPLRHPGIPMLVAIKRASFMTKTVQYQNELHKFLIWDTAGQERFRALAPMYYRGSAAAIIVYDITKEETFSTLKNWVKELRQHGPPNIVVAIAGNKCDLIDVREVMERDAKDYADSIHAIFVETSAKNAININELFIEISRRIPSADANPPSGGKGFKLRRQPSEPQRSCC
uniref:RAB22A, member RAS onco family n=1 Tax=Canis lupus familiaris TaxID=9615 RepID=A0A8P0TFK3_CANLF